MRSVPGEGSTFSFTLPLFGARAQARSPVVVVATTDPGTRREARRVAEDLGFTVHEAADGVEAVESAARLRPVAMVLDRVLPRLQAEEVAERLQGQAATRGVPLLVLAAGEDLGSRSTLFRECLPLPLERRALAAALERLGATVR